MKNEKERSVMSKALVAFFSAEGTTAKVAKTLAGAVEADIFEIRPVQPYTEADIKWTNPLARCNREKLGRKDVPISGRVSGMEDYDVVFLGFPIWYYGAPNIINTFVKGYDLSGKRLALFATSGGSDMGRTAEKLKPYLSEGAVIADSKLFSASAGAEELKAWAEKVMN